MTKKTEPSKTVPLQAKLDQLHALLAWFDSAEFTLEESIAKFKQAETVAAEIEQDLTKLKNEIKIVKQRFDQAQ